MKKIVLKNEGETISFAKNFAKNLSGGETIALTGDLGSGKTTFTKALAHQIGIKDTITSPTFNIIRAYNIPKSKQRLSTKLFHIDVYRLNNENELLELGVEDFFRSTKTITIIEWAEKVKKILPKNTVFIDFNIGKNNERIISIK